MRSLLLISCLTFVGCQQRNQPRQVVPYKQNFMFKSEETIHTVVRLEREQWEAIKVYYMDGKELKSMVCRKQNHGTREGLKVICDVPADKSINVKTIVHRDMNYPPPAEYFGETVEEFRLFYEIHLHNPDEYPR